MSVASSTNGQQLIVKYCNQFVQVYTQISKLKKYNTHKEMQYAQWPFILFITGYQFTRRSSLHRMHKV